MTKQSSNTQDSRESNSSSSDGSSSNSSGDSGSNDKDDNDHTAKRTGGLTKTKNLLGVFAQATKNPILVGNDEDTKIRNMILNKQIGCLNSGLRVQQKRGDWEELVDQTTGRTIYYNAGLDEVRFERPKRWVRMLAEQVENDGNKEAVEAEQEEGRRKDPSALELVRRARLKRVRSAAEKMR